MAQSVGPGQPKPVDVRWSDLRKRTIALAGVRAPISGPVVALGPGNHDVMAEADDGVRIVSRVAKQGCSRSTRHRKSYENQGPSPLGPPAWHQKGEGEHQWQCDAG